jgi:broad specificity phosphatase PhoE
MPTTKIMIVRHAEKPVNGVAGVTVQGVDDAEELTVQGWQRAGALIGLFSPPRGQACRPGLATPQRLFASGIGPHSKSLRPQHTILPLSAKLGQKIDTSILKGGEAELVDRITNVGGIVLVAWEHEAIPTIAQAILRQAGSCPANWPDNRFDLVWVFDRAIGAGPWSFSQVPQLLLAGDEAGLISLE